MNPPLAAFRRYRPQQPWAPPMRVQYPPVCYAVGPHRHLQNPPNLHHRLPRRVLCKQPLPRLRRAHFRRPTWWPWPPSDGASLPSFVHPALWDWGVVQRDPHDPPLGAFHRRCRPQQTWAPPMRVQHCPVCNVLGPHRHLQNPPNLHHRLPRCALCKRPLPRPRRAHFGRLTWWPWPPSGGASLPSFVHPALWDWSAVWLDSQCPRVGVFHCLCHLQQPWGPQMRILCSLVHSLLGLHRALQNLPSVHHSRPGHHLCSRDLTDVTALHSVWLKQKCYMLHHPCSHSWPATLF
mmetsp:Transcript_10929/g.19493  ORF Transcript_10929/g.19493 Transcript_10929/m.19493 type:complete len:292 (-) Transcript_10929:2999-3874(-)